MKLEEYSFSPEEIQNLKIYRDQQKDPRLQQRFLALLMSAENIPLQTITFVIGKSTYTLQRWFKKYYTDGISVLNSFQYKPKECFLKPEQIQELIKWVRKENPVNRELIREYIQDQFNVTYSKNAISDILKKNGIKRIHPRLVPGKPPEVEEQKKFVSQYNQVKEFQNFDSGIIALFVDGMHLVHQVLPAACWGDPKDPPIFRTNSSRQRLNILGAYHPSTQRLVHLTSEDNCNAQQIIKFFESILKSYPDKHSIVLYVDNASYFHSKKLVEWLKQHEQIIVEHLPVYAPNLNLIERLWRFVKKKLVKNRYYVVYKVFRTHTFQLLNNLCEYTKELKSLITENFEIISLPKKLLKN